ncbi:esterase OVCA2 [Nephila pilipes]|uniref:Esterase OVCA2 n=1 Tax=Nephila pilipes TaxID=299642 RepID=A0A8X6UHN4_NEPPI|nr:esterase OVCA2 [Nephila pilipes]
MWSHPKFTDKSIVEVYGDKATSRQRAAKWCRYFQADKEHVENRNMEASGRPSSSRTDINMARVEKIIQRDRRVTVREIASELDLSYGNVQRIVTDELRYSKIRILLLLPYIPLQSINHNHAVSQSTDHSLCCYLSIIDQSIRKLKSGSIMAVNRKLKLLCLHGYRQDADSFKDKIGGFKKSIKGTTELVFLNAPHEIPSESCIDDPENGVTLLRGGRSWWFCDKSNNFNSRTKCEEAKGFKESVEAVSEAFKTQGPFDGILGFSQGGALAALICALKEHQAGFQSISTCHQYLYTKTVNIQSLHIIGENDLCISKDRSEELIPLFKSSSVVYHDGGHFIPSKSSIKNEYLPFFKNMYCVINKISD